MQSHNISIMLTYQHLHTIHESAATILVRLSNRELLLTLENLKHSGLRSVHLSLQFLTQNARLVTLIVTCAA